MRKGIPEQLVIHADRNESVGILLERAAHAALEFFSKPALLLLVCMNGRGRPSQQDDLASYTANWSGRCSWPPATS